MGAAIRIISLVFFLLLVASYVSAEVIIFDNYDETLKLDHGKLIVQKQLRMKNVGTAPIIPGEIHFQLYGQKVAPEVFSFTVVDKFGKELDTKIVTNEDSSVLVFTVWDPLLPNFFYDVTMNYEIEFKPKGLLFYSVQLPSEQTTIPIKSSSTEIHLPKNYFVTYAYNGSLVPNDESRVIRWSPSSDIFFEYSFIPLPKTGFRMVNVFWILLMIIFITLLVFRFKKAKGW